MRQIYVLNLDHKRLMVVIGIILALLGSAILAGMHLGSERKIKNEGIGNLSIPTTNSLANNSNQQSSIDEIVRNAEPDSGVIVKLNEDPMLPELERKSGIVNAKPKEKNNDKLKMVNDPFIRLPPPKSSRLPVKKSGNYSIQVAAFTHEKQAIKLVKDMRKKNLSARVVRGSRYWLVKSGFSSSRNGLKSQAKKIKSNGFDALIMRN